MRIKPNERQELTDIIREEIDQAAGRISARLAQYECHPAAVRTDKFDHIRCFYTDLTENDWTDTDEETLSIYSDLNEVQIKRMMREGYRRSQVHPVPSFGMLMNVARKCNGEQTSDVPLILSNPDAISAVERERIANLLHLELEEAARGIAARLKLGDTKLDIIREELEIVEGAIISRFTPLV
ncbi:MAG TPA: hypothetical protein VIG62_20790 [Blastocatellia bacterium]|jgi:hypothetical protein